jgi:hypothetical protein
MKKKIIFQKQRIRNNKEKIKQLINKQIRDYANKIQNL